MGRFEVVALVALMLGVLAGSFFLTLGIFRYVEESHVVPTLREDCTKWEPIRCFRDECGLTTVCDHMGKNCTTQYECSLGEFPCPPILEEYY